VKPGTVQLLYMAKVYYNLARSSWGGKLYIFKDQMEVSIFEVNAQTEDTSCVMSSVESEIRTLARVDSHHQQPRYGSPCTLEMNALTLSVTV